ncbi:acetoin dehydrogenase dihydrolipoyllysine-residue acetyltransferase subunit [Enterovibrio norvegicus FF-162]|uniref:acetoin dehydrogenase dihydrolipoyllysine-residue acetyltransferase subunit n=1 Tax=Enterovibrio norvegicus TaxID=188144 RepID=UPI0002EE07FC|nr:acetoin dehydrogenase dihydrolipoyllysine-residue acetyltransferase subunit [Enterovibrio norvegicus]OEE89327.1 acetoin dehydrogenase dihydrolipoyllysine-residue acetyltransferase subunit [Enterovibrio norvegicus FF-162]
MSSKIVALVMPKWGLSMKEGTLTEWHVNEGDTIEVGQIIMDVETDKIASEVEAPDPGLFRRKVAQEGDVYSVQALLGVLAPEEVSESEIDDYVATFVQPDTNDEDAQEQASAYAFTDTAIGKIRYTYLNQDAEGTPFMLIHGFGGDLDNWLFNIDALSNVAPVIALDLPAHGQSVIPNFALTLADLTQTVVDLLDRLNVPKAHWVGHSMGGFICSEIARQHPEKVQSLTMIASAGLGKTINGDYIQGFIDANNRRELKPVLQLLFADSSLVTRSLVDDVLKYKRLDGVNTALAYLANELFPSHIQQHAASLSLPLPTLVIWGDKDAVIPASDANTLPDAECHVLENAGHMVQMEKANEVNTIILAHSANQ